MLFVTLIIFATLSLEPVSKQLPMLLLLPVVTPSSLASSLCSPSPSIVQNYAVCLLNRCGQFTRPAPTLRDLRWLLTKILHPDSKSFLSRIKFSIVPILLILRLA